MRRLLAFLCMVVFLCGTALCEDTQAIPPEESIITEVSEQEQVPSEAPILEEQLPTIDGEPHTNSPPIEEDIPIELEQEKPAQQPEELEPPVEEPTEQLVESEEKPSETPTEVQPQEQIKISEEVLTTPMPEIEPVDETPTEEPLESEEVIVPEELVEIEDDDWGHIDEELLPREVHISFLTEPRFFGDEATLVITLINFKPEDEYTIYWQYCTDFNTNSPTWITIDGEHDRLYTFTIDKTNYLYGYRVLVQLKEDE